MSENVRLLRQSIGAWVGTTGSTPPIPPEEYNYIYPTGNTGTALRAAIVSCGSDRYTMVITNGIWNLDDITSNLTIPENIEVEFNSDSYFKWTQTTHKIKILNLENSHENRIFNCPLNNPPIVTVEVKLEHFGALGDFNPATMSGTDDYVPIQTCVNCSLESGVVTRALAKKYRITDSIVYAGSSTISSFTMLKGEFADRGTDLSAIKGTVFVMDNPMPTSGPSDPYTGTFSKYCIVYTKGTLVTVSTIYAEDILCWSAQYRQHRGIYLDQVAYNIHFTRISIMLMDYGIITNHAFGMEFDKMSIEYCGVGMLISLDANAINIRNSNIRGCNRFAIQLDQGAQISISGLDIEGGGPIALQGCSGINITNIYGELNNTVPLFPGDYSVGTLNIHNCFQISIDNILVGTAGKQIYFTSCNLINIGSVTTYSSNNDPFSFDAACFNIRYMVNLPSGNSSIYSAVSGYDKSNLINFTARNFICDNEFRIAASHRTNPVGAGIITGTWASIDFSNDVNSLVPGRPVLHLLQNNNVANLYGWVVDVPIDMRGKTVHFSITTKGNGGAHKIIIREYVTDSSTPETLVATIPNNNTWTTSVTNLTLLSDYKLIIMIKAETIPCDLWVSSVYLSLTADQAENESVSQLIAGSGVKSLPVGSNYVGLRVNSPYEKFQVMLTAIGYCNVWYTTGNDGVPYFLIFANATPVDVAYLIIPDTKLSLY
jgi:hypothetical protein